jgi:hypothetical protein
MTRRVFMAAAGVGLLRQAGSTTVDHVTLSPAEVERFLATAKVVASKRLSTGVTGSSKLTLSDGHVTHDAHVQSIDESKVQFQSGANVEMNFRDCWKFNIAAYKLDRLLELHMTPPSVERRWAGKDCAFTFWIADATMESERRNRKIAPPDADRFNRQMNIVRVFDQLICNTDRNLQNLLITPDWNLWMIDHTRCFRVRRDLPEPRYLVACERQLLAKLRNLTRPDLANVIKRYCKSMELDGLLARRDRIVARFEALIAEKGESKVVYDLPSRTLAFQLGEPRDKTKHPIS